MANEDLPGLGFQAQMLPEEQASYLAWCEALDHWEEDGVEVEDFEARFCNKSVDCGKCLLWPQHHGNCTRYMGP